MTGMLNYEYFVEYYHTIICIFALSFSILIFILYYHGVFYKVEVKTARPPFTKDTFVVYKFTQNYTESRDLLTEVQNIAPDFDSFSIYHENFYQTRSQVGSSVGVVLPENIEENLYRKLIQAGYKVAIFPAIDFAVVASFPYKNQYSLVIAVYRTYPRLKQYIKAYRLCAHPIMELYTKDTVFFIAPLSKQFDFYAEEAIPEYEESTSEEENEFSDDLEYSKSRYHHSSLKSQCYCDPFLHSSSCDRRKRALFKLVT
ncbi:testis-expressed protein 264-like isoform X2 [Stegodyphus dumicola]|uniref:testis-expressed protein 264-like isoform X2 n=1 Tax=Stegodyphus dumicola TaxID=202533 RepID=UPI0015AC1EE2|nr:testis-expressed protein 264-like isoform X2 [Stegodyphus dumicola]